MQYGSLQNILIDGTTEIVPTVGMGATILGWTDRRAYTIIEVSKSGKTITLQRDNAIRIDKLGMTDSQQYEYKRDTKGAITKVRKDRQGKWKELYSKNTVVLNKRDEYHDYSF